MPDSGPRKVSNSSALLRAQIAKAKQEARRASTNTAAAAPLWDTETDDPFNQVSKDGGNSGLLRKRIEAARVDGRLNIAGMGLPEIPVEVFQMYEFDPDSNVVWSESVDLVRFNAADNELKALPDSAFPDKVPNGDEEEGTPHQFGGVEILDLHGNLLESLPRGIRRLEHLTSLNLTRNKLKDIHIITEIPNLKELRISENLIESLPNSISHLSKLEVLEVHHNKIAELPDKIRKLTCLRLLNIAHNKIRDLRLSMLSELPLAHIHASKNELSGVLLPKDWSMPRLQTLDVSCNDLTALTPSPEDQIEVPNLQILNISFNRISSFPSIATWTNLTNILAEDNGLKELPHGFATLTSLRSVDLTGNDIKVLDPLIAHMDNLEVLNVAANPLRDRKFLTMSADDIKKDLRARLEAPGFVAY